MSRALFLAAAGLVLGGVACGSDYDRTEFSGVVVDDFSNGNDSSQSISVTHLQVHEGLMMKSHIVAWNDDNTQMNLTVASEQPDVVEIAAVISDRDYAFIGRKVGHTRIRFTANDKVVLVIDADVVPQPSAE